MANDEAEDFSDWWDSLTFYNDEGELDYGYTEEWKEDHADMVWALEYAFEHEWDIDAFLDEWDYEDMADFWEWFRENYE